MEFRRGLIDCAIIKADIKRPNMTYVIDYKVRISDIEEAIRFIKTAYEELGMPCSRIYLSGFELVSESSIRSKQEIVELIQKEISNILKIEQEKNIIGCKK